MIETAIITLVIATKFCIDNPQYLHGLRSVMKPGLFLATCRRPDFMAASYLNGRLACIQEQQAAGQRHIES